MGFLGGFWLQNPTKEGFAKGPFFGPFRINLTQARVFSGGIESFKTADVDKVFIFLPIVRLKWEKPIT